MMDTVSVKRLRKTTNKPTHGGKCIDALFEDINSVKDTVYVVLKC